MLKRGRAATARSVGAARSGGFGSKPLEFGAQAGLPALSVCRLEAPEDLHRRLKEHEGDPALADFTCPICWDPFWQPVRTVCGHAFCKGCLLKAVLGQLEREAPDVCCPVCRHPLHVDDVFDDEALRTRIKLVLGQREAAAQVRRAAEQRPGTRSAARPGTSGLPQGRGSMGSSRGFTAPPRPRTEGGLLPAHPRPGTAGIPGPGVPIDSLLLMGSRPGTAGTLAFGLDLPGAGSRPGTAGGPQSLPADPLLAAGLLGASWGAAARGPCALEDVLGAAAATAPSPDDGGGARWSAGWSASTGAPPTSVRAPRRSGARPARAACPVEIARGDLAGTHAELAAQLERPAGSAPSPAARSPSWWGAPARPPTGAAARQPGSSRGPAWPEFAPAAPALLRRRGSGAAALQEPPERQGAARGALAAAHCAQAEAARGALPRRRRTGWGATGPAPAGWGLDGLARAAGTSGPAAAAAAPRRSSAAGRARPCAPGAFVAAAGDESATAASLP